MNISTANVFNVHITYFLLLNRVLNFKTKKFPCYWSIGAGFTLFVKRRRRKKFSNLNCGYIKCMDEMTNICVLDRLDKYIGVNKNLKHKFKLLSNKKV